MASAGTFTPELVPEEELPVELAERGLYKPAGIACHHCAFVTKKKGFSGRQALRAHGKKHKNNTRAWQRPLMRQGAIAGFIVALAVQLRRRSLHSGRCDMVDEGSFVFVGPKGA